MKLLAILLIIWLMIKPVSMPANFVSNDSKSNIIITRDKMIIKTVLPDWNVEHNIILKEGLNRGYYALTESQSFSYEIINN